MADIKIKIKGLKAESAIMKGLMQALKPHKIESGMRKPSLHMPEVHSKG